MTITHDMQDDKLIKYLEGFGKVEVIKPIKNFQGKKIAKDSYFLSLSTNSSLEDKTFLDICKKNNVILQLDVFQEV